jgi:hypothetical protein
MAKEDILSKQEKQKIRDDYNALNEEGIMEVLKYGAGRELSQIKNLYSMQSKDERNKARAKRTLELSIDDENIINLVQSLRNKLNNIEDAAKQMTRENTSPENYLPFYNLITQQGDYGPEGSKSISLGRKIRSQETLPVLKNMGGLVGYAQGGNMNIKEQTQNVANQGRYGDSMLLHVNPAEVKGLAQAMPITVNPQTGQPEAFLPFLAPVLGSMAGGALFTSLSPALAAGIGAGLATYAQTGGSGSKALLSGLTAGFGANALGNAANTATTTATQAGTDAATQLATSVPANLGIDTATQAIAQNPAQIASNVGAQAATEAGKQIASNVANPTFMQRLTGPNSIIGDTKQIFAGGFDEGAKTLASAAMSPSGLVAGTGLAGRSIINSQELFEEQMRQMEMDEEQRKRDMYANNPEVQLYTAAGGLTQFNDGGFVSSARNLANKMSDDQYGYEAGKQVYAPAKQQYAVNPDFMAGFAPETMYFRPDTLNAPSMSTRGGSAPTLGPDTYTGTKGGYDYEGSYDADGNFVAGTAQGVQFAPQTAIDPYAAYSGSAPQGLVQSAYNPYPVQPMSMSPTDETEDTSNYGGIGGEDFYSGNPDFDFSFYNATDSAGNILTSSPYGAYDQQAVQDIRDQYSNYFFDYDDIQDFYRDEMSDIGRNSGGDTNVEVDKLPENLQKMYNSGPKGKEGVQKIAAKTDKFDNGGNTEMKSVPVNDFRKDPMTQQVIAFLMGDSDNTKIVDMFVDKYGNETFMALREMVLNPDGTKQTEGLIAGMGNSGMADDLLGSIGNKEKIAVSQDEFIVPADVVSGLGDGSSDAGSKELYAMMDRVRQKRTGTTKQPAMLANAGGLLPA